MTVGALGRRGTRAPRPSSAPRPATPRRRWRRTPPRPGSSRSCWCPEGKIAAGKMAQAIMHGAQVIMVRGNFDDCLRLSRGARRATTRSRWSTRSTRCGSRARRPRPSRSSTSSATPPTSTCCRSATPATSRPTGWATAVRRRSAAPPSTPADARLPGRGRRAAGDRRAVPRPGDRWRPRSGSATPPRGTSPRRRATSPAAGSLRVSDDQILAAQRELAAADGVFVEPASAAGVAGLLPRLAAGDVVRRQADRRHGDRSRPQGHRHRAVDASPSSSTPSSTPTSTAAAEAAGLR